jgi:hypothetical protein
MQYHFVSSWTDSLTFPPPHFTSFITFLTPFLKLIGVQETVPKASSGSWFQSWMVLFTKEYFPMSILCSKQMGFVTKMRYNNYKVLYLVRLYSERIPKQLMDYTPRGTRFIGRLKLRWKISPSYR